jgi:hypothetical protein
MISVPKILSQKLLVIPNPVIRYTEVGFEFLCSGEDICCGILG